MNDLTISWASRVLRLVRRAVGTQMILDKMAAAQNGATNPATASSLPPPPRFLFNIQSGEHNVVSDQYLPLGGLGPHYLNDIAMYAPWFYDRVFVSMFLTSGTNMINYRAYNMYVLLRQAMKAGENLGAEVWELGTYQGDSAVFMAQMMVGCVNRLRLFDTFDGMPETMAEVDIHSKGDFADTSDQFVLQRMSKYQSPITLHAGLIPASFNGLEASNISFVHVDLDIYVSVRESAEFVWPMLVPGGVILFDDYGFQSCPGARLAVDEFCHRHGLTPFVLPSGQAYVVKLAHSV